MDQGAFDMRIKRLSVMVGSDQATDLFASAYEELLGEVQAVEDKVRRYGYAERMSKLLLLQMSCVVKQYLGVAGSTRRCTSMPFMGRA